SATAAGLAELLGVPPFVLGLVPGAATHAHADAPPAGGRFPVRVRLSGHRGFRGESQAWFEELVSHGYVVISLDQPGSAAHTVLPDGRELAAVPKEEILPFMPEQLDEDTVPIMNGVELPGGLIPFLARTRAWSWIAPLRSTTATSCSPAASTPTAPVCSGCRWGATPRPRPAGRTSASVPASRPTPGR